MSFRSIFIENSAGKTCECINRSIRSKLQEDLLLCFAGTFKRFSIIEQGKDKPAFFKHLVQLIS